MKKFLSAILALALVLSLGTVAFADNASGAPIEDLSDGADHSATAEVKVVAAAANEPDTKYLVNITYDSLTFEYTRESWGSWDTTDLYYPSYTAGKWDKLSADITVENRSNAALSGTAEYASASTVDGVNITITAGGTISLDSADKDVTGANATTENAGTATKATITVSVDGAPTSEDQISTVTAGTVTIKLKDPTALD